MGQARRASCVLVGEEQLTAGRVDAGCEPGHFVTQLYPRNAVDINHTSAHTTRSATHPTHATQIANPAHSTKARVRRSRVSGHGQRIR
jgi:hypothetical protein